MTSSSPSVFYGNSNLTLLVGSTSTSNNAAPLDGADALAISRKILTYTAPFIVILGLILNSLNIAVLTRPGMRRSSATNRYLSALAVSDTVYLLTYIVFTLILYEPKLKQDPIYNCYIRYSIGYSGSNLCSNFSTLLTCVFTFERWLAVTHPLRIRGISTVKVLSILFLINFILTFPDFIVKYCNSDLEMQSREDAFHKLGYYYARAIIFIILPLIFLIIFNSLLIRTVLNREHRMSGLREQKLTTMLCAVVLLFCVCQIPGAFLSIKESLESVFNIEVITKNDNYVRVAGGFSNILLLLSATLNFFLYSAFSTSFRRTFSQLTRSRRRLHSRAPRPSNTANISSTALYSNVHHNNNNHSFSIVNNLD